MDAEGAWFLLIHLWMEQTFDAGVVFHLLILHHQSSNPSVDFHCQIHWWTVIPLHQRMKEEKEGWSYHLRICHDVFLGEEEMDCEKETD